MAEYIEREAAISVACKGCNKEFPNEPCEPADCHIQQWLFAIPAADVVEVRHGVWIPIEHEYRNKFERVMIADEFDCNLCGTRLGYKANYCPNCGADMRGDDNG